MKIQPLSSGLIVRTGFDIGSCLVGRDPLVMQMAGRDARELFGQRPDNREWVREVLRVGVRLERDNLKAVR